MQGFELITSLCLTGYGWRHS